jgi:hypothetical protein
MNPGGLYSLFVVGPETGNRYDWGYPEAVDKLMEYGSPVLGLGWGGSSLFSQMDLFIGWGQGWIGAASDLFVVDQDHQIWHSPYHVPMPKNRIVTLYDKRSPFIAIYAPQPLREVMPLGRQSDNDTHYPLIQERRYLLWGYNAGPSAMTDEGRHLFVNVMRYLTGM